VLPKNPPLVPANLLVAAILIYELGCGPLVGKIPRASKIVRVPLPQVSQCVAVLPDSGWRWVILNRNYIDGTELERCLDSLSR
jgi:hypothetical protein